MESLQKDADALSFPVEIEMAGLKKDAGALCVPVDIMNNAHVQKDDDVQRKMRVE